MLRVFVDADVVFAGAASSQDHSASQVILRVAELTLIDAVCTEQVIREVERNLGAYLPDALPVARLLVNRCLRVTSDPERDDVLVHAGRAHPKDLPLLVAALREQCKLLVTYNVKDYRPGHPALEVVSPGVLVQRIREALSIMPRP